MAGLVAQAAALADNLAAVAVAMAVMAATVKWLAQVAVAAYLPMVAMLLILQTPHTPQAVEEECLVTVAAAMEEAAIPPETQVPASLSTKRRTEREIHYF